MGFNAYIPGDYKVTCDRCGFEFRISQLTKEWTGLMVCQQCWDFEPLYPTGPADKISVPIPRPEQETEVYDLVPTEQIYGVNLFPDPWIDPLNNGLWSAGITSQRHVYAEYYSKRLNSESSSVTVTGLTIGHTYRIKTNLWTSDAVRVLINGVDTGLFSETLLIDQWFSDTVFIIALAENITVTFENLEATDAWFDNIYIQEFTETYPTPAEQIANKKITTVVTDLSAQPNLYTFFTFDDNYDFNSSGFDDGVMVNILD